MPDVEPLAPVIFRIVDLELAGLRNMLRVHPIHRFVHVQARRRRSQVIEPEEDGQ